MNRVVFDDYLVHLVMRVMAFMGIIQVKYHQPRPNMSLMYSVDLRSDTSTCKKLRTAETAQKNLNSLLNSLLIKFLILYLL